MHKTFKFTYILLIIAVTAYSCRQAKYVPEGKFLLKKNIIHVEEKNLDITKSIEYALRIQSAILPPLKIVKQNVATDDKYTNL